MTQSIFHNIRTPHNITTSWILAFLLISCSQSNTTNVQDTDPCATSVEVSYQVIDTTQHCLRRVTESRCAGYWSDYNNMCQDVEEILRETSGRCLLLDCGPSNVQSDPQTALYPVFDQNDACSVALEEVGVKPCPLNTHP